MVLEHLDNYPHIKKKEREILCQLHKLLKKQKKKLKMDHGF